MNQLERLSSGLLKPMNPYGASLLGALTLTWGLWIVNPFWDVFARAEIYGKASDFAPEWAWGTWSTACGIAILLALWKGSTSWLARASCFAVWHWFTISGMLWWGDWQNTAGLTYMFVGLYSIFTYLNIKVNFVMQDIHKF